MESPSCSLELDDAAARDGGGGEDTAFVLSESAIATNKAVAVLRDAGKYRVPVLEGDEPVPVVRSHENTPGSIVRFPAGSKIMAILVDYRSLAAPRIGHFRSDLTSDGASQDTILNIMAQIVSMGIEKASGSEEEPYRVFYEPIRTHPQLTGTEGLLYVRVWIVFQSPRVTEYNPGSLLEVKMLADAEVDREYQGLVNQSNRSGPGVDVNLRSNLAMAKLLRRTRYVVANRVAMRNHFAVYLSRGSEASRLSIDGPISASDHALNPLCAFTVESTMEMLRDDPKVADCYKDYGSYIMRTNHRTGTVGLNFTAGGFYEVCARTAFTPQAVRTLRLPFVGHSDMLRAALINICGRHVSTLNLRVPMRGDPVEDDRLVRAVLSFVRIVDREHSSVPSSGEVVASSSRGSGVDLTSFVVRPSGSADFMPPPPPPPPAGGASVSNPSCGAPSEEEGSDDSDSDDDDDGGRPRVGGSRRRSLVGRRYGGSSGPIPGHGSGMSETAAALTAGVGVGPWARLKSAASGGSSDDVARRGAMTDPGSDAVPDSERAATIMRGWNNAKRCLEGNSGMVDYMEMTEDYLVATVGGLEVVASCFRKAEEWRSVVSASSMLQGGTGGMPSGDTVSSGGGGTSGVRNTPIEVFKERVHVMQIMQRASHCAADADMATRYEDAKKTQASNARALLNEFMSTSNRATVFMQAVFDFYMRYVHITEDDRESSVAEERRRFSIPPWQVWGSNISLGSSWLLSMAEMMETTARCYTSHFNVLDMRIAVMSVYNLTTYMASHLRVAGDESVGKSFIMDEIVSLLIAGCVTNITASSPKAHTTGADYTGQIRYSEEAQQKETTFDGPEHRWLKAAMTARVVSTDRARVDGENRVVTDTIETVTGFVMFQSTNERDRMPPPMRSRWSVQHPAAYGSTRTDRTLSEMGAPLRSQYVYTSMRHSFQCEQSMVAFIEHLRYAGVFTLSTHVFNPIKTSMCAVAEELGASAGIPRHWTRVLNHVVTRTILRAASLYFGNEFTSLSELCAFIDTHNGATIESIMRMQPAAYALREDVVAGVVHFSSDMIPSGQSEVILRIALSVCSHLLNLVVHPCDGKPCMSLLFRDVASRTLGTPVCDWGTTVLSKHGRTPLWEGRRARARTRDRAGDGVTDDETEGRDKASDHVFGRTLNAMSNRYVSVFSGQPCTHFGDVDRRSPRTHAFGSAARLHRPARGGYGPVRPPPGVVEEPSDEVVRAATEAMENWPVDSNMLFPGTTSFYELDDATVQSRGGSVVAIPWISDEELAESVVGYGKSMDRTTVRDLIPRLRQTEVKTQPPTDVASLIMHFRKAGFYIISVRYRHVDRAGNVSYHIDGFMAAEGTGHPGEDERLTGGFYIENGMVRCKYFRKGEWPEGMTVKIIASPSDVHDESLAPGGGGGSSAYGMDVGGDVDAVSNFPIERGAFMRLRSAIEYSSVRRTCPILSSTVVKRETPEYEAPGGDGGSGYDDSSTEGGSDRPSGAMGGEGSTSYTGRKRRSGQRGFRRGSKRARSRVTQKLTLISTSALARLSDTYAACPPKGFTDFDLRVLTQIVSASHPYSGTRSVVVGLPPLHPSIPFWTGRAIQFRPDPSAPVLKYKGTPKREGYVEGSVSGPVVGITEPHVAELVQVIEGSDEITETCDITEDEDEFAHKQHMIACAIPADHPDWERSRPGVIHRETIRITERKMRDEGARVLTRAVSAARKLREYFATRESAPRGSADWHRAVNSINATLRTLRGDMKKVTLGCYPLNIIPRRVVSKLDACIRRELTAIATGAPVGVYDEDGGERPTPDSVYPKGVIAISAEEESRLWQHVSTSSCASAREMGLVRRGYLAVHPPVGAFEKEMDRYDPIEVESVFRKACSIAGFDFERYARAIRFADADVGGDAESVVSRRSELGMAVDAHAAGEDDGVSVADSADTYASREEFEVDANEFNVVRRGIDGLAIGDGAPMDEEEEEVDV